MDRNRPGEEWDAQGKNPRKNLCSLKKRRTFATLKWKHWRAPYPARMVELVDTQAWGACVRFRTCRFKSCFGHRFSKTVDPIAQSVEHFTFNERALGSSPSWITDRSVKLCFGERFIFILTILLTVLPPLTPCCMGGCPFCIKNTIEASLHAESKENCGVLLPNSC